jgi:hypothetical protein
LLVLRKKQARPGRMRPSCPEPGCAYHALYRVATKAVGG